MLMLLAKFEFDGWFNFFRSKELSKKSNSPKPDDIIVMWSNVHEWKGRPNGALPKNMWRLCVTTLPPFLNLLSLTDPGGGYSTLVWVGVCRWDFWNATHPCTYFEGKVPHPCTKNQNFLLKFAPFWRKFRKILKSWPIKVPNLRHFGANFRKFWKIDPSKYHVFEKKGPIDVPGGLILLPMFAAHPYNHFCTEYPPGDWPPFYFSHFALT